MSCEYCKYHRERDTTPPWSHFPCPPEHWCAKDGRWSYTPEGAKERRESDLETLTRLRKEHNGVCPYFKPAWLSADERRELREEFYTKNVWFFLCVLIAMIYLLSWVSKLWS